MVGLVRSSLSQEPVEGRKVVRPVSFELTTFCSGGKRSIQTELRAHVSIVPVAGPNRCTAYPLTSDNDLQRKLDIERFARSNARRADVISDRIENPSKAAGVQLGPGGRSHGSSTRARNREVGPVKQIEHLHAELRADALRDRGILGHCKVHDGKARTEQRVARQVSERTGSRLGEGGAIEILHVFAAIRIRDDRLASALVRIANEIGTVAP